MGTGDEDALQMGTRLNDGTLLDDGDTLEVEYRVSVDGSAGEILDTSKLGIEFSAAGGYRTTQYIGSTKN